MIERSPKPGDIGLTSVRGPVGRLISVGEFLNGDGFTIWEHAFIVLDGDRLIEAQPGGPGSNRSRSTTTGTWCSWRRPG